MRILDSGRVGGQYFLAMELLEGRRMAPADVGRLLRELASALQALGELGIVHRDIKPSNVMRTGDGAFHLMDFGLASDPEQTQLTVTGMRVGTPMYLSPEVAEGRPADGRSDLFRDVPPELDAAIERCLERDPGRRFSAAQGLLAALAAPATFTRHLSVSTPSTTGRLPPSVPGGAARRALLRAGLAGAVAMALLLLWLRGPIAPLPPAGVRNLRAVAGARAALVSWGSAEPSPSRLVLQTALGERAIDGWEAAPTTSHEVLLEGLEPGTNYLVYVAHADGSRSVPVAVALPPDAPGLGARVSVERWSEATAAVLIEARLPVRVEVVWPGARGGESPTSGQGFATEHVLLRGGMTRDEALRGGRARLRGVDRSEELPVPGLPGAREACAEFSRALRPVEASELCRQVRPYLARVKAGEAYLPARLAAASPLVASFFSTRWALRSALSEGAAPPAPDLQGLYEAVFKVAGVDALAEFLEVEPPLRALDEASVLGGLWWPKQLPAEATSVVTVPWNRTLLGLFGLTDGLAQMAQGMVNIRTTPEVLELAGVVPSRPGAGGRSTWLALRVLNLSPELFVRVQVHGGAVLYLRNRRAAFNGTVFFDAAPSRRDYVSAANWVAVRCPNGLLRPGPTRFTLTLGSVLREAYRAVRVLEVRALDGEAFGPR